jgi:hypothetical protein
MSKPFFAKDRVTDLLLFARHSEHAIDKMKQCLAQGHPLDFQDIVSRFTMDTATEFLCGSSVNSLDMPLPRLGKGELW